MAQRKIITLVGSSRFPEAHAIATMHFSLMGCVVIPLSCYGHADQPTGAKFLTNDGAADCDAKIALDSLHFDKIAMSDEIYVINPGGYLGDSTKREIAFAISKGVAVYYMFPDR